MIRGAIAGETRLAPLVIRDADKTTEPVNNELLEH